MAAFIQNSAVNSVGLEQQEFDFTEPGIPKQIPINPDVNGNTTWTRAGHWDWYGGALAQDGIIYCPPYGETAILAINTKTKKAFTIEVSGVVTKDQTYGSFVAHPNGKLYGMPMDCGNVLEFDPINKSYSKFGSGSIPGRSGPLGGGMNLWAKGIVAPNGHIYCVPSNSNEILKVDVYNKTASVFGDTGYIGSSPDTATGDHGDSKFCTGILVGDKIYMIPYSANDSYIQGTDSPNKNWIVGIIDTTNDTIDTTSFKFGENELPQIDDNAATPNNNGGAYGSANGSRVGAPFESAVKGIDGKIYCVPSDYPYVCVIDPQTNTISRMSNTPLGTVDGTGTSTKFGYNDPNYGYRDQPVDCAILAANGKIYGYVDGFNVARPARPYANTMVEIDTENATHRIIELPITLDGDTYKNAFWFPCSVLGPDGGIYGIPYFQNFTNTDAGTPNNSSYGDMPCVWFPPSASLPAPWILTNNQNGVF